MQQDQTTDLTTVRLPKKEKNMSLGRELKDELKAHLSVTSKRLTGKLVQYRAYKGIKRPKKPKLENL